MGVLIYFLFDFVYIWLYYYHRIGKIAIVYCRVANLVEKDDKISWKI